MPRGAASERGSARPDPSDRLHERGLDPPAARLHHGDMRSPSLLVCLTLALPTLIPAQRDGDARAPNVVVVYTDDQGWADIGTQGA